MADDLFIPTREKSRVIYGKIPMPPKIKNESISDRISAYKIYFDPNDTEKKFKLSPFTKIFEGDSGNIALFHIYLSKKMYGGDELKKCLNDIRETGRGKTEILQKLAENSFVIPSDFSEEDYKKNFIENFRKTFYNMTPSIGLMYLILTDKCNFGCKYCFIEKGALKDNPRYGDMSYETAKAGVDFFIKQLKFPGDKTIIFYGGEPLINFDVLKKIVIYIREREMQGHFKGNVRIQMVTNASLVTPEIARFIAEQKINAGVSIDGPKEIHDKMRVLINGDGGFDDTIRGYWMLKNAGANVGISCTIGKHNVNVLDKVVEYFANDLKVKGIGFNTPHLVKGQEDLMIPAEDVTENLIKAAAVCRKYGIGEDRLFNRRVMPFVEENFWFTDCAGCGNQIVVLPNGAVGPCHAFLGLLKYFKGSVYHDEDIASNPVWIEWKRRAPIFMPQCLDCPSISICGGGCPYMAHEINGSIWEIDKDICTLCNKTLEWLIGELHEKLQNSVRA